MLEVRLLTKRYSGIPVVDAVSFSIRPGEILGYLGPNGLMGRRYMPSRFHDAAKIQYTGSPVWTLMTTAVD